jgi:hypothetical protein
MKTLFIKLHCIEETEDGIVMVNAGNISTVKRLNYNDIVQTMVMMIGGERFGVHEEPEEIAEMIEQAQEAIGA